MTDFDAVTEALAAQIQARTQLKMFAEMPDQVNVPCGAILPGTPLAKYGITLGEGAMAGGFPMQIPVPTEYNLVVAVFVSRAPSLQRAQVTVKSYLGMNASGLSIPRAILYDPTLGGIVEYCEPVTIRAFGDIEVAGQQYFQGQIAVLVSVTEDFGA